MADMYPHMCRDGHQEIGHRDSEHEMCPLCRALADRDQLLEALKVLFADYKRLADSGDAGNWSLEDLPCGQQALAAIAKTEGANHG